MRKAVPASLWTGRSLRFQALMLVVGLVVLIVVAGGFIIDAENSAAQQDQVSTQAASLRYSAYVYASRIDDEENALDHYALNRDRSTLVDYNRDRQRAEDARAALAPMPAAGTVAAERRRLLAAADSVQAWTDDLYSRLQEELPVPSSFYADGQALDESLDAEAAIFDWRAGSAANVARDASAAAGQRIRTWTLLGVGLGTVGVLLLAWLFFIGNLRPITRLIAAASQLSRGDDAEIPTGEGTQEVRELSEALAVWRGLTEARLTLTDDLAVVSDQVDPDEVLARASRLLSRQFQADLLGVSVLDPENELISHLIAEPGVGLGGVNRAPVPPGSPVSHCLRTRRPMLTDMRDARWPQAVRSFAAASRLGSALLVPMVSAGQPVGAVTMVRSVDKAPFTKDDLGRARMMVPHLASSFNVVRLIKYLEHANRHKSEFLALMSHELRTPLNSILGFAQLLSTQEFGELNQRQRRYVEHIENSGTHLLALINDVLELAKVEAGRLEINPEVVGLKPLLSACVEEMMPLANHKTQNLQLRMRSSLSVRADSRRLRQVVLNLVSNAIKFTPDGGTVTVETERDGSEVLIHVRDTGVGVPPAERERIFEAFTQVRKGRTRSEEGTGLGLAVSRRLMELMGGSLVLDSRAGRGSTFTMRLPAAAGAVISAAV